MNESLVFYRSFYEAIKWLNDDDQLACYRSIFEYGINGKEPDVTGAARAVFECCKAQIDANNRRRENGCKGGRPSAEAEPKDNQTKTKQKPNHNLTITKPEPNVNVNVNDNVNVNVNTDKEVRPHPPTAEEVELESLNHGYKVVAEEFIAYYASQGWKKSNGQPMTDWRAALKSWNLRSGSFGKGRDKPSTGNRKTADGRIIEGSIRLGGRNTFNQFDQHDYDMSALNKKAKGAV